MIEIKPADKTNVPLIQQLAYTIWNVAYKDILSKEQLAYMLDKMHSIETLKKLIDNGHQFIIPYEDGVAKGYSCFKFYNDKTRIEKLYVLPDQHKKGIGKLLLNYIIEKSKPHVNIIELNVNRHNKAIDFYKRVGFEIVKEVDIPIGEGYFMNDYVMTLTL